MQKNKFFHAGFEAVCSSAAKKLAALTMVSAVGSTGLVANNCSFTACAQTDSEKEDADKMDVEDTSTGNTSDSSASTQKTPAIIPPPLPHPPQLAYPFAAARGTEPMAPQLMLPPPTTQIHAGSGSDAGEVATGPLRDTLQPPPWVRPAASGGDTQVPATCLGAQTASPTQLCRPRTKRWRMKFDWLGQQDNLQGADADAAEDNGKAAELRDYKLGGRPETLAAETDVVGVYYRCPHCKKRVIVPWYESVNHRCPVHGSVHFPLDDEIGEHEFGEGLAYRCPDCGGHETVAYGCSRVWEHDCGAHWDWVRSERKKRVIEGGHQLPTVTFTTASGEQGESCIMGEIGEFTPENPETSLEVPALKCPSSRSPFAPEKGIVTVREFDSNEQLTASGKYSFFLEKDPITGKKNTVTLVPHRKIPPLMYAPLCRWNTCDLPASLQQSQPPHPPCPLTGPSHSSSRLSQFPNAGRAQLNMQPDNLPTATTVSDMNKQQTSLGDNSPMPTKMCAIGTRKPRAVASSSGSCSSSSSASYDYSVSSSSSSCSSSSCSSSSCSSSSSSSSSSRATLIPRTSLPLPNGTSLELGNDPVSAVINFLSSLANNTRNGILSFFGSPDSNK